MIRNTIKKSSGFLTPDPEILSDELTAGQPPEHANLCGLVLTSRVTPTLGRQRRAVDRSDSLNQLQPQITNNSLSIFHLR